MIKNLDEAIINIGQTRKNKHGDAKKNDVLYSRWDKRYSKTLGDFYDDFIEPRLPEHDVVLKWHKMLMEYAEMDEAVFPIRDGHTDATDDKLQLRRGWLVRVDYDLQKKDRFSYVFTDNYFPAYIYKMALDGFCPKVDEFYKFMTEFVKADEIDWLEELSKSSKKKGVKIENVFDETLEKERCFARMPIRFGQVGKSTYPGDTETKKNAYINTYPAPACKFGDYGYKHAHILAVKGKNGANSFYNFNGEDQEWRDIGLVELGEESLEKKDYQWDNSINNYVWHRQMNNSNESKALKKVVIAHFLRFLDPINHFLAPMQGCNKFTKLNGDYSLDIGEYENLLEYLMLIREKEFGRDYDDFKEAVLASSKVSAVDHSAEEIDIIYHEDKQAAASKKNKKDTEDARLAKRICKKTGKTSTKTVGCSSKKGRATSSTGRSSSLTAKGTNKTVVFDTLNDLISRNLIDEAMLNNLTDHDFTLHTFGIPSTYSLLVKDSDFTRLGCDTKKYYNPERLTINGEKYRVCSQWIPKRIKKLEEWYDKF